MVDQEESDIAETDLLIQNMEAQQQTQPLSDNKVATPTVRQPPAETNEQSRTISRNEMKYGAQHIVKVFIPVTICMFVVVFFIKLLKIYGQKNNAVQAPYIIFNEDSSDSTSTLLKKVVINALALVLFITVATFGLVLLYKYRCYKFINGYLLFASVLLLFMLGLFNAYQICMELNIVVDIFTMTILMWNFGVLGIIAIHWKSPLILQQAYLICSSAFLALQLIVIFPNYTCWVILFAMSVYDLISVLMPFGPLRLLVNIAETRQEPLFRALIYSSMVYMANEERSTPPPLAPNEDFSTVESNSSFTDVNIRPSRTPEEPSASASNRTSEEENSVKLGLGDFIFYSILVGKACQSDDWNTVVASLVAILCGLCLTIVILAFHNRALPALPFSIMLGLLSYVLTSFFLTPLIDDLTLRQVFI